MANSRTVLISGANGGLGSEVVHALARRNHRIVAAVGRGDLPDNFQEEVLAYEVLNVLDEAEAKAFVDRMTQSYPELDAAVLLVGSFAMGNLLSTATAVLDKQIALNFKSAWSLIIPLMAHFGTTNGGQFVLVGARPALQPEDAQQMVAYALSKRMLMYLAEIINASTTDHNVVASVIVPSIIDTPANRDAMPDANPSDWISPAAIAETIDFILSDTGRTMRQPVFKMYNAS